MRVLLGGADASGTAVLRVLLGGAGASGTAALRVLLGGAEDRERCGTPDLRAVRAADA
nr:hypothetical protein OG781_37745 [Streptomyces sp. NBC_00830]